MLEKSLGHEKTSIWIDQIKCELGKELDQYSFYRLKWINKHRNARLEKTSLWLIKI